MGTTSRKRGRKLLLLAGLAAVGSAVLKNLREQQPAPAPAAPTAPPAAPVAPPVPDASAGPQVVAEDVLAAPVLQAPVTEEPVTEEPVSEEPVSEEPVSEEAFVDTSSFAPITDVSPETPADGTVAEPAEQTGPPADSLTSFFDEVLTETQETKRGRRR